MLSQVSKATFIVAEIFYTINHFTLKKKVLFA